jgi:hypothetical protein
MKETGKVPETQTRRQGRQAPSTSELKRLHTRHNTLSPLKGREHGGVHALLRTKKQECNSSVQNAT